MRSGWRSILGHTLALDAVYAATALAFVELAAAVLLGERLPAAAATLTFGAEALLGWGCLALLVVAVSGPPRLRPLAGDRGSRQVLLLLAAPFCVGASWLSATLGPGALVLGGFA